MADNRKEQERAELHRTIWGISTYVVQEDTREVIDIKVLNAEIDRIVAREDVLRHEINAIITEIEGVSV